MSNSTKAGLFWSCVVSALVTGAIAVWAALDERWILAAVMAGLTALVVFNAFEAKRGDTDLDGRIEPPADK